MSSNLAGETPGQTPKTAPGWLAELQKNPKLLMLGAIGVAATLFLMAGALVLVLRKRRRAAVNATVPPALGAPASAEQPAQLAGKEADPSLATEEHLALPEPQNPMEALIQSVRESVTQDPAVSAGIIREWLRQS